MIGFFYVRNLVAVVIIIALAAIGVVSSGGARADGAANPEAPPIDQGDDFFSGLFRSASYPTKPEAPVPPAGYNTFTTASTVWTDEHLSGTGVYLCNEVSGIPGPACAGGAVRSDQDILNHADGMGARQIWVRCGDSRRGFTAAAKSALTRFVQAAHTRNKIVVCWDVPNFWNVQEDARRIAEMSLYADAIASDIESGVDNISSLPWASNPQGGGYAGPELLTAKGERWATRYSGWVRYYVGQYGRSALDYPLLAVTMQPQTHPSYPFAELGTSFNVMSPMLYRGVCRSPTFVAEGIAFLRGLPGIDMSRHRILISGLAYSQGNSSDPCQNIRASNAQIRSDIEQAKAGGAIGASWFVFQAILSNGWQAGVASWGDALTLPPPQDGRRAHADFTGDGKADIAVLYDYGSSHVRIWLMRANASGTGFNAPEMWYDSGSGGWDWKRSRIVAGDFTGDGIADLAVAYDYGRTHMRIWTFPTNDTRTGFDPKILYYDAGEGAWNVYGSTWLTGDVNGDGLDDVVAFTNDWNARVSTTMFLTGTGMAPQEWHDSGEGNWDWTRSKVVVDDFTGDGNADFGTLYDYGGSHTRFWVQPTNAAGTGFDGMLLWYDSGAGNWNWSQSQIHASDATADTKADLTIMYDYGNRHVRFWTLPTDASGTGHLGLQLWYDSGAGNWDWNQSRELIDDFTGDGRSDISTLYDYGNRHVRFWTLVTNAASTAFEPLQMWYDSGQGNWDTSQSLLN